MTKHKCNYGISDRKTLRLLVQQVKDLEMKVDHLIEQQRYDYEKVPFYSGDQNDE